MGLFDKIVYFPQPTVDSSVCEEDLLEVKTAAGCPSGFTETVWPTGWDGRPQIGGWYLLDKMECWLWSFLGTGPTLMQGIVTRTESFDKRSSQCSMFS